MKLLILVLSLASVAFAQLDTLVEHEVGMIVGANPSISLDDCADTCDYLFNLVDVVDEVVTDTLCRRTCDCKLNNICLKPTTDAAANPTTTSDPQTTQQPQTTQPPHTTNAPHTHKPHTHHPHPTHPDHGHHG